MAKTKTLLFRISLVASALALFVVILGAYTRLVDGGLGCPDWPGCYGHVMVPSSPHALAQAAHDFPATPIVEPQKAWSEMIHRYFAGTLGLLIFLIVGISFFKRRELGLSFLFPLGLLALLFFQAALGMWTVTWQLLPVVVMGHLLGGLTILSVLWLLMLKMKTPAQIDNSNYRSLKPFALLGLLLVFLQIALGGWTSSNYAALICPTFPACHGQLIPTMDFKNGFNIFAPIGVNYLGGELASSARVAIQMVHRYGALLVFCYIGLFALYLLCAQHTKPLRRLALLLWVILLTQLSLGILNIEWLLPLPIAVAHNAFAALLLLTIITVTYRIVNKTTQS